MNNDELKKKIVKELNKLQDYGYMIRVTYNESTGTGSGTSHQVTNDYIADTLIAAGIGDVSSEKAMRELAEAFHREKCAEYDLLNYQMQKSEYGIAEAEHRAEVAERKAIVLSKWLADKTRKDYPYQAWLEAAQKQAEKELAEERKK